MLFIKLYIKPKLYTCSHNHTHTHIHFVCYICFVYISAQYVKYTNEEQDNEYNKIILIDTFVI